MPYTLPEGSDEFAKKALTIGRVYAEDMEDVPFGDLVQAIAAELRKAHADGFEKARQDERDWLANALI